MNAKEASALLGLHPNTIYKMIRNGEIKAEKKGKSFDIPMSEIDRLMGDNQITLKDALSSLEVVEVYLQKQIDEIQAVLENGNQVFSDYGDPFEAMDHQSRYESFIKQLDFMKKYIKQGQSMFQKTKNGVTVTYSKVVSDNDKDE